MKRTATMLLLGATLLLEATGCSIGPAGTPTATPVVTRDQASPTAEGETAATGDVGTKGTTSVAIRRPAGWTQETHSNDVAPDYEVVYPENKVNEIKITIAPDDWQAMQDNLTELLGAHRTGQQPGGAGAWGIRPNRGLPPAAPGEMGDAPPASAEVPDGGVPRWPRERGEDGLGAAPEAPEEDGAMPAPQAGKRPGGPGGGDFTSVNPSWVPATIEFEGRTWTNVGIRYKGNSSLRSGWASGSLKLPLKLDFDEFEDEHPEIKNQRFYGFKQMSLSNAFSDNAYMRDAITYHLLEEAGLVAAETAYYHVILDHGEGPIDLGIYVAVELIDDTVIERYFGGEIGNVYEGNGQGVTLAEGTRSQIKTSFEKENNEDQGDWGDIEALYDVLHSTERTTDPASWRERLEAVFDVPTFLKWLAISAVIENWDTYGSMAHNFYLYHDHTTDRLTWISWDHNMVLGNGGGMRGRGSSSLDKKEVGKTWPLIRYLLDDATYYDRYVTYMAEFVDGPFNMEKLEPWIQQKAALIAPYVAKEKDEVAFNTAVTQLLTRVEERVQATTTFLGTRR